MPLQNPLPSTAITPLSMHPTIHPHILKLMKLRKQLFSSLRHSCSSHLEYAQKVCGRSLGPFVGFSLLPATRPTPQSPPPLKMNSTAPTVAAPLQGKDASPSTPHQTDPAPPNRDSRELRFVLRLLYSNPIRTVDETPCV